MMVHIRAASRLHFGLLHVPVEGQDNIDENLNPIPHYGGIGIMMNLPGLTVEAQPAKSWHFAGSLAERAKQCIASLPPQSPLAITIDGPPEHNGFGVGTSVGMALAEIYGHFQNQSFSSAHDIARVCQRGRRSCIGVAGYMTGGFIVDHGKAKPEEFSKTENFAFPWPVVLIRPRGIPLTWSGERERAAFAHPRSLASAVAHFHKLHDLLYSQLLPALRCQNYFEFCDAIHLYNRLAGEPFREVQGGDYSSPEVAACIQHLKNLGYHGVGQSSWGPTVFAVMESESAAQELICRLGNDKYDMLIKANAAGPRVMEVC